MGLSENNFVNAITISSADSNFLLVGAGYADGSIFKSENGGQSWREVRSGGAFVYDLKFDPRDVAVIYAATEGEGVLVSRDAGESWQVLGQGIFYPVIYSLDITDTAPITLIAGSFAAGVYSIQPD
jgi:photosystem II stability/assembly factor-like uncharacterized protein